MVEARLLEVEHLLSTGERRRRITSSVARRDQGRALVQQNVTPDERVRFEHGARALGAAFQKVNFLRDLAADFETLGRSYFPGVSVDSFTEEDKIRLLDDIDDDLRLSATVIPDLPASSRKAVALAQGLFAELSVRLRATPADELRRVRIRVPNPVKLRIAAGAMLGAKAKA